MPPDASPLPACILPETPALHGVKESAPDDHGRVSFTLYWRGANTRTRAQCFRAVPEHYPTVTWHSTEAEAKAAAWGVVADFQGVAS